MLISISYLWDFYVNYIGFEFIILNRLQHKYIHHKCIPKIGGNILDWSGNLFFFCFLN